MTRPVDSIAWLLVVIATSCGDDDTGTRPDGATTLDAAATDDAARHDDASVLPDGARDHDAAGLDAAHAPDASAPDATTPDAGPPELPPCPAFDDPVEIGTVATGALDEASGLVASRVHAGVLWLHNDSGDDARLFAIGLDGEHVGTLSLSVDRPRDIEDMAIAPAADGGWFLYLGDIGDNDEARASISILRVREPDVLPSERPFAVTLEADVLEVTYADGAHNAETLLADPEAGDLFIVEKTSAAVSGLYRVAAPFAPGGSVVADRVATIATGRSLGLTTGGDVSADGREIVVRGYGRTASLWRRLAGSPLADAFAIDACEIPIADEPQGETFGWMPDGSGYLTVSEGSAQPIFRSARR
ncbi:MAG: hypothetical protein IT379_08080 [Deltaproteobacteria bacterium]|nr:hypothetical protein [Deltaproteobacteria bacterium]